MTGFKTQLIHGQTIDDNATGAINVPIYNSSTYEFPTADSKVRWDYERSGNPTREFLEKQIALLENGTDGFAFSSGLAAIHAIFASFRPGNHIIVGKNVYGGTYRLINQHFKDWGLDFTIVDTQNLEAVESTINEHTKAIYFETFSNPLLEATSVKAIAAIAKRHNILTIVDNTFLTSYLQQPLTLGADIVVHSATKYLGGHSDVVAGLVVTKTHDLGQKIYFTQNGLGGILSPDSSNLIRRGIQTLAVRMRAHQENAAAVVEYLSDQKEIKAIYYPGIKGTSSYEIASQESRGFGGVLSFELDDKFSAVKFVNHLKLFKLAVSLGAVESLAELPYTMTHAELPPEERLKSGISPQLIRLSIGLEEEADLIADLQQALTFVKEGS